jgi:hypothetical protein
VKFSIPFSAHFSRVKNRDVGMALEAVFRRLLTQSHFAPETAVQLRYVVTSIDGPSVSTLTVPSRPI